VTILTGRLHLTREELDQKCKPSGLYPSCPNWEPRQIRRLVADGKLASRLVGSDGETCLHSTTADQECPICFLFYSEINTANCCKAAICTECYLQLQTPKMTNACPFCNGEGMMVTVAKKLEEEEVKRRQVEEQRVIESNIMEKYGKPSDKITTTAAAVTTGISTGTSASTVERQGSSSFGSNLEAELESRSRSRTMSSDLIVNGESIMVMSPEERRALEEEVRSQSHHPLVRKMSQEAERERERHELEYIQRRILDGERNRQRRQQHQQQQTRHLDELFGFPLVGTRNVVGVGMDRSSSDVGGDGGGEGRGSGNGSGGGSNNDRDRLSLDDLIMWEAAFLLSMRDGTGRGGREGRGGGANTANNSTTTTTNNAPGAPNDLSSSRLYFTRNDSHNRRNDGRPSHQRDAERTFVSSLIRDYDRNHGRVSSYHAYPVRHVYGVPLPPQSPPRMSNEESLLATLSEENQLELAIRLSLLEAQRRGDAVSTTTDESVEQNAMTSSVVPGGEDNVQSDHSPPQDQGTDSNRRGGESING